jgi:predicted AAA+ superfamily ATPase
MRGRSVETVIYPLLQGYVSTVLYRDIAERFHVTNLNVLKILIRHKLQNLATHFTVNKFSHHLKSQGIKVAKTTVHEYIDHLAEYLDGRCQIIQVATDVSDSGTREREVRSLVEAGPG